MLLDWFLQPLGLVFTVLLIGLLLILRSGAVSPVQTSALVGSTMLLWLCSAPLTANSMVKWMERPRYTVPDVCFGGGEEGPSTVSLPIVVLGADLDAYVESDNPYRVLSRESLMRTLHAADLDSGNTAYYLMGGGQTSRKLSDYMAAVLAEQGIPESRIVRDRLSLSTRGNAERLRELLAADTSAPITLITSALHMNRAVHVFDDLGFMVCPSASASLYSVSAGWVGLLPYITGLSKTTLVIREWLATLKFRAVGVISDLRARY